MIDILRCFRLKPSPAIGHAHLSALSRKVGVSFTRNRTNTKYQFFYDTRICHTCIPRLRDHYRYYFLLLSAVFILCISPNMAPSGGEILIPKAIRLAK